MCCALRAVTFPRPSSAGVSQTAQHANDGLGMLTHACCLGSLVACLLHASFAVTNATGCEQYRDCGFVRT